jgi:predicted ATPase/DNA-binding SARP family transcriptional activator
MSPARTATQPTLASVSVFGGVTAAGPDGPRSLGGPQERTLVALLVAHRPSPVMTERLVDLLWPDDPPPTATKTVQVYVGRLRDSLGREAIETVADGYRLSGWVAVDLDAVERQIREGTAAMGDDPLVALDLLEEALATARGEPFAGVGHHPALRTEAERVIELIARAREARFEILLGLGRLEPILSELPAAARRDPWREGLWLTLMRAQAEAGRGAEAIASYDAARRTLREDLQIEPGPELTALRDELVAGPRSGDGHPPAGTPRAFRGHLPESGGAFIGRRELVSALVDRLRPGRSRLVTLTGPGGIGKTRLAIEVARELADRFDGAVAFVDLGAVLDPMLVWPTIREGLGLQGEARDAIGRRRGLLVLDNPERVVAARPDRGGSSAIAALLAEAPRLQVLVASRVPLRLGDEAEVVVEPLEPDDAAALFRERTRAAEGSSDGAAVVTAICERLDRLPLAIELAALQARVLPERDLLRALERRLPTLVGGQRDAPARHHTIEAAIDWSFDLLSPGAQRLFSTLAVFEGGWTVRAAEEVCGATAAELGELVDHSLIRRSGGRLTMLDTIHEYASARLEASGGRDAIATRHADWLLAEARERVANMRPDESPYRLMTDEIANTRVAMETLCREPVTDRALDLAILFWGTWLSQGRIEEGDGWFRRAIERSSRERRPDWGVAVAVAGEFPRYLGDYERAEAMKLEAIAVARRVGDLALVAASLTDVAEVALRRGDPALARARFEEALAIRRGLGVPGGIAHAAHGLAELLADDGEDERAAELYEEAIRISRDEGIVGPSSASTGPEALAGLGRVLVRSGDLERAARLLRESVSVAWQLGTLESLRIALESLASHAVAVGDESGAAVLLGAAAGIRARVGARDDSVERRRPLEAAIRERLGPAVMEEAFDRGREAPLELILEQSVGGIAPTHPMDHG